MKKLVAITALVSGALLILAPRYILPACEYEGFSPMHCSDTARAEFVVGVLLMLIGGVVSFVTSVKILITGAGAAIVMYVVAYRLPDTFGYCHSSRMPCNYGMVPGIRFIAMTGALIMIVASVNLMKMIRKKGNQ